MTVRDVRQSGFSYGLGMGLLVAMLLIATIGCVTEEPKEEKPFEKLISSINKNKPNYTSTKKLSESLSQDPDGAVPGDPSSPEVKARRKAWKAARKAVRKALIKMYATRTKPGFAPNPVILPVGAGRHHIFGYVNSVDSNGMLLQKAFEAWIQRRLFGNRCESLTIDGQPVKEKSEEKKAP